MSTRDLIPDNVIIANWSDDELAAFATDMASHITSCQNALNDARDPNHRRRIMAAMTHYQRGQRVASEVLRVRHGEPPIHFGPVRPVHTFLSAFHTLKAVNRLLGCCESLNDAISEFLEVWADEDADVDDQVELVRVAHSHLAAALSFGGIDNETGDS